MSGGSVKISLEIIDKAAQKALSDFISNSDKADKASKKLGDSGSSAFKEIGVSIGKTIGIYDIFVGNLAANLATKAFETIIASAQKLFSVLVVDGVNAAKEQEEAQNELNQALARSGQYSEDAALEFDRFASELQATTGVADELILKNTALISSLTGLDQKGLKAATRAALDMSAALGKDLTSASEAVAKAANGNVTALQKLGLTIQKGNSDAETFANTLAVLEANFGGAAAAKINTFAGSVSLVQNSFGELQESIGNTIIKNNVVIETLKALSGIFQEGSESIKGQTLAWKQFIGEGIIVSIGAMLRVVSVFDLLLQQARVLGQYLSAPFKALQAASSATVGVLTGDIDKVVNSISGGIKRIGGDINDAAAADTAVSELGTSLARLQQAAEKGFTSLQNGASTSLEPLNRVKGKFTELNEEQKKANTELENFVVGLARSNEDGQVLLDAKVESYRLAYEQQKITLDEFYAKQTEAEAMFFQAQQARLDEANARNIGSIELRDKAQQGLDDKRAKASAKAEREITKAKEAEEKQRGENLKSSLSYISTLQQSSVREFFFIGKAAALATAYIDGQAAVMKALAAAPPPFNFALAAAVGLAAGVNIARIASAEPPSFEQGGIVPGTSYSGDRVQANVNSGEMILNRPQQAELFKLANGAGSNGNLESKIDQLISIVASKDERVVVNIGGKTIVDTLKSELSAGRSFA